jgi:hypothetical protein
MNRQQFVITTQQPHQYVWCTKLPSIASFTITPMSSASPGRVLQAEKLL